MIHNFGPGTQRVHDIERCGPRRVHPDRYFVEPIAEKMPVLVQGHRSAGVPEHLLHDLDVGTRGDRQRRGRVP